MAILSAWQECVEDIALFYDIVSLNVHLIC